MLHEGWRLAVSLLPLKEGSGQGMKNIFCPLTF